jgi:CheY-like chemotaxis protein
MPRSPDESDSATHQRAFEALQRAGEIGAASLDSAYGELFARLDATQQRDFVRRVIVQTNRRQINWTHLALGELVRERIVHTLLTTNFDDLLLDGLVRCDQLPAIIDGVESLNRMDPRPPVPQLVYLHGSQHTYSPRNSTQAVLGTRNLAQAQGGLYGLLQQCSLLCVVGYGGNAGEGVMEMLLNASRALPELPIYWVAHGQQDSLSTMALQLLGSHAGARLIAGQDSDLFFRELLRQARIGVPAWFRDPVDHVLSLAERICVERRPECAELGDEVDDFRARLRALHPAWEEVGAATRERRELRQLLLADHHAELWDRIGARELDDPALLQMRAEAAYELGRRHRTDLLRQAVRDWSAVLRRLSEGTPEWALAKVRHGDALATLGERGDERAVRDAIRAYEDALVVRTRQANPLEWAATRNNQGLALLALGEWGDHQALEAALMAFADALEVSTRDAAPIEWAVAQCNRANALQILGRTRGDAVRLEQAVLAYEEALQIHTRHQRPADWAMTHCDRAAALVGLGQLGFDQRLREAVRVLDEVAEATSRDTSPQAWATIRNNLGVALLAQGQRGDEQALRRGIDVLREAMHLHAGDGPAADMAVTSHNLGSALLELGRRGHEEALREANEILTSATELLNGEVFPRDQRLDIKALGQRVFEELRRVVARQASVLPGHDLEPPGSPATTHVLVVEDDQVHQVQIREMLRQCVHGVEPQICPDGTTALAALAKRLPDLVVLDLALPDMDGRTVLERLRQEHPRLPVLVYSGDAEALSALQSETSQALAVLNKDSGAEAFTRLVPKLFKRRNSDRHRSSVKGIGAHA